MLYLILVVSVTQLIGYQQFLLHEYSPQQAKKINCSVLE